MRILLAFFIFHFSFFIPAFAAVDLTSSAEIERTADTAFAAKSNATNAARRQTFAEVLSRYSDADAIRLSAEKIPSPELLNLIAKMSIANEKTSTTSYSATFTITYDRAAASAWLDRNGLPNYMGANDTAGDKYATTITFNNGLRDWVRFAKCMRETDPNIQMNVRYIFEKRVTLEIPVAQSAAFATASRICQ